MPKEEGASGVNVNDLIKTAAQEEGGGSVSEGGEPASPPAADDDEKMAIMAELFKLIESDPALAEKIAGVIENHLGGASMENMQPGGAMAANMPGPAPGNMGPAGGNMGPAAATAGPAAPMGQMGQMGPMGQPGPANLPPEIMDRLSRIEHTTADMALEREIGEAKQEYDALKDHFPILPELNDREILQIALDKGGLPLKDALLLWAMQKMREGEGSVADRITAAKMEASKAKGLPKVEGKGGAIPSGEAKPPENMKDARAMAKEKLRAMFSAMPG